MQSQPRFFRDGKYLLLFGFSAVFMGNFGQSFYLGGYGASIQQSLDLSASAYGLIYSLATLAAGSCLMVVGGFIDKISLFRFTSYVSVGLLIASLLFVFSSNVWVLLAAFFLVRLCGQGLLPHTGITTMARCFSADRGKAISVAACGVPVGEIILPLLAAILISLVGWQNSWLFVTLLVPLIFLPLSYLLLRNAQQKGFDFMPAKNSLRQGDNPQGRAEVLRDKRFWRALPAVLMAPFLVTGLFIQQSFFMAEKQWSLQLFALGFIVYGLVHWLSSLVAGVIVDKFTAVRVLAFYNLPMLLAMVLVAFYSGDYMAFVLLGLLGVSIGFSGPVTGALWAEVYGTVKIGSIRSMTTSFGVWSTSLSPVLFGVLIDKGVSLATLCLSLAAAIFVAGILAFFSYRLKDFNPV
ncbi:Predicted arabinose efflux permease, MFS family [Alteromonadaceae bacterium Bs31]|nr:Predicted arabinose efflux permease, MFS family [Alteromonadaceae bacterium Bs31]